MAAKAQQSSKDTSTKVSKTMGYNIQYVANQNHQSNLDLKGPQQFRFTSRIFTPSRSMSWVKSALLMSIKACDFCIIWLFQVCWIKTYNKSFTLSTFKRKHTLWVTIAPVGFTKHPSLLEIDNQVTNNGFSLIPFLLSIFTSLVKP